jgi:hypothetical protein
MEIGITELHTSFLDSSLHTLIQEPHYSLRICNWPRRENTNKETNLLLQIQCIWLIFWEPSDPESYSFFSCSQKLDNARTSSSYSLSHTIHTRILTRQPRRNMRCKQSLLLCELQIGDVASPTVSYYYYYIQNHSCFIFWKSVVRLWPWKLFFRAVFLPSPQIPSEKRRIITSTKITIIPPTQIPICQC